MVASFPAVHIHVSPTPYHLVCSPLPPCHPPSHSKTRSRPLPFLPLSSPPPAVLWLPLQGKQPSDTTISKKRKTKKTDRPTQVFSRTLSQDTDNCTTKNACHMWSVPASPIPMRGTQPPAKFGGR